MRISLCFAALFVLAFVTGCQSAQNNYYAADGMKMAVCEIMPTAGNSAKGTVSFMQMGDKVMVTADITGLTPNAKHGFHIHDGTECGDDGMKAAGHYNPTSQPHGMPDMAAHHAGDMGNLQADAGGKAHLEITLDGISIDGAKSPIVGHAVIVHAKTDDGGQPVGNAGARIGCGIIKAKAN